MKLNAKKFALAAGIIMSVVSLIRYLLMMFACHKMAHMITHPGMIDAQRAGRCCAKMCCPWMAMPVVIIASFLGAFVVAWAFATLYNYLMDKA